jgi:Tfp pilus assembly protein PilP
VNRALTGTVVLLLSACGFASAAATQPAPQPAQPQPAQQSPQPSARPPRPPSYSDRYSILTQRNIFLKDRSRGGSRNGSTTGPTTSSAATQPARRSPEETLLLRGIVVEQGEVRAYFEDIVNSRIVRVGQGDAIARGRIASIDLDLVEYEPTAAAAGAKRTFVVVGHDLTGKVSALDAGMSGEGGDAAMATTGPVMPSGVAGLNPNDPNLTPEQKMKLRRAMELKK